MEEEERGGRGEEEEEKARSYKNPKVCLYRDILIPFDNIGSLQINPHSTCHL